MRRRWYQFEKLALFFLGLIFVVPPVAVYLRWEKWMQKRRANARRV